MKKVFKIFALAAVALSVTTFVGCKDEEKEEENNTPTGNTENLPTSFEYNFDDSKLDGWTLIDADGDGYKFQALSSAINGTGSGHNGSADAAASASYVNGIGALTPDNYMVSQKVYIEDGATLKWFVAAQDANYPQEHYAVEIGTLENGTFTKTATVFEETFSGNSKDQSAWYERTVNLSEYKGQSVYIAFHHYNCTDMFWLLLDDISLTK